MDGAAHLASVIGVEGAQVVDVSQQMGPAALLGTVVVVVGGVEVADQHASKPLAQDFTTTALPRPRRLGGSAESPDVAVVAILPPARFVGMYHWAGADAVHNPSHHAVGPAARCDGWRSRWQPRHTAGWTRAIWPSSRSVARTPRHQYRWRCRQRRRQANLQPEPPALDDLPSALGPTAGQLGSAGGSGVPPVAWASCGRAKPWRRCLRGPGCAGGFRPDFALRPGIRRDARFRLAFQFGNPPLQPLNHPLLFQNGGLQLGDDGDEDSAVGGGEVNFSIHALYMT